MYTSVLLIVSVSFIQKTCNFVDIHDCAMDITVTVQHNIKHLNVLFKCMKVVYSTAC